MQMGHRIRRLHWQVKAKSEDGFRLHQRIRADWQDQLVQSLATEFDRIVDDDEVLYLSQLALHIRLPANNDISEAIEQQLRSQLYEQLVATRTSSPSMDRPNPGLTQRPLATTQLAMLWAYLQQGRVAWPLVQDETATTGQRCQEILRQHQLDIAQRAFSVMQSEAFYFRLIQLMSVQQTQSLLVEHWLPGFPQALRLLLERIVRELLPVQISEISHVTTQLLARLIVSIKQEMTVSLYSELASDLPAPTKQVWQEALARIALSDHRLASELTGKPALELAARKHSISNPENSPVTDEEVNDSLATATAKADVSQPPQADHDIALDEKTDLHNLQQDIEPYFVHAAGLVLLHPFLGGLFTSVGLLADDKKSLLVNELPRAAALLHFLATAGEEIHEFDLNLIKVMLGIHPTQVLLVGRGLLTVHDKEEADTLLQAVIGHWQVLKATTIQGLRQAFMQRSGLLRESEFNFALQVERKGHDALLEHLPWGYSLIKLPWMTKALFTQW